MIEIHGNSPFPLLGEPTYLSREALRLGRLGLHMSTIAYHQMLKLALVDTGRQCWSAYTCRLCLIGWPYEGVLQVPTHADGLEHS